MPRLAVGAKVNVTSEGAVGAAAPANALQLGATDGTNLQACTIYAGGEGFSSATKGLYVAGLQLVANISAAATSISRFIATWYNSSTGVNANGAGSTINATASPHSKFTLQVVRTAGSSAYVVDLEGSLDGTNFFSLGTLSSSSAIDAIHITNKPVRYYRYNVTTIGSGNTLSVLSMASKY